MQRLSFLILIAAILFPAHASAQIDIAGEWATRLHEDQPHRNPGPSLGDYTGLPLNDNARMKADSWDASIYSLKEHQTKQLTVTYGFHGIANMRISKVIDDATQRVVAYKIFRSPGTGNTRMVWMDGRSRPPEYAAHTWQGFSTGRWAGGMLIVQTSHMKVGVIQRNGVPTSDRARLTEHFIRHGNYLTVVGIIDDPLYLDEPLVRSWNYALNPDQQLQPVPAQIVDELAGLRKGQVPHYLPGHNPYLREFAEHFGLPFEATRGGRETMYPEYAVKLRELLAKRPRPSTQ